MAGPGRARAKCVIDVRTSMCAHVETDDDGREIPCIMPPGARYGCVGEPSASRFGALRRITKIVDASDDLLAAGGFDSICDFLAQR